LPISNSFGAMFTFEQKALVDDSGTFTSGIHFNPDGTKMFTVVSTPASGETYTNVSEYILSKPFDVSTKVYAGDDQRCILNSGDTTRGPVSKVHDLEFSNDGLMLFVSRGNTAAHANDDRVFRFDLTSPYDLETCAFANQTSDLDTGTLQDGSNAGDITEGSNNRLQGFEINNDGTKLFAIFHGASSQNTRLLEYQLSTAYDLSTISIITDAGIELNDEATNPKGLRFSPDGKRFWVTDHQATATGRDVVQVSLDVAFSTSSFTIDGTASIADSNEQSNGIAFSAAGLKMYIPNENDNEIYEYHLVCPFNIIAGKCPPVTENSVRTGIAEAQIMIAKRTIDHSTKSALNRLEWIRRNKDNQNLSNLNIDFNFNTATQLDNPLLNYWVKKLPDRIVSVNEEVENGQSITIGREYKKSNKSSNNLDNFTTAFKSDNPLLYSWINKLPEKITALQTSAKKKTEDKQQDIFFWSEGSIAVGRVGDTNISSFKKLELKHYTWS